MVAPDAAAQLDVPRGNAIAVDPRSRGSLMVRLRAYLPLIGALAIAAATRVAAIAYVHPPLVSDFGHYEQLARHIAQTGPIFADVPTGYSTIVGALYVVFGAHPVLGEYVNLVAGLATAALVYRMGGLASGLLFAVLPEQVLTTTLFGTDVLYALALTLVVFLVVERWSWVLTGIVVGLSQYVRSSAELVALAVAAVGIRTPRHLAAFAGAAGLVLAPVIAFNLSAGRVSASTSDYLGWQVLIGTNQAHDGQYNTDDRVYAADPWPVAIERVTGDPVGFAGLVVRKELNTWTNEQWLPQALGLHDPVDFRVYQVATIGLVLVIGRVLLSVLALGRAAPMALALMGVFAFAYAFTESQGRYHFYFVPLALVLSDRLRWPRLAVAVDREREVRIRSRGALEPDVVQARDMIEHEPWVDVVVAR